MVPLYKINTKHDFFKLINLSKRKKNTITLKLYTDLEKQKIFMKISRDAVTMSVTAK